MFVVNKLFVPKESRPYMLQRIHKTHLGMEKCKSRAREIMYWTGVLCDIEEIVSRCKPNNQRELMIPHKVPNWP